jgi:hypothetical protein
MYLKFSLYFTESTLFLSCKAQLFTGVRRNNGYSANYTRHTNTPRRLRLYELFYFPSFIRLNGQIGSVYFKQKFRHIIFLNGEKLSSIRRLDYNLKDV